MSGPDDDGTRVFDIAIIGAGPAGLMAALKSTLLFHSAVVLDKGNRHSRAFFVPRMDNIPGYPRGVSGSDLLAGLREQIRYAEGVSGKRFVTFEKPVEVTTLDHLQSGGFEVGGCRLREDGSKGAFIRVQARAVVLATGAVDQQPLIHEDGYSITPIFPYAGKGIADYCVLCDGHTVRGKRVAVLGLDEAALEVAMTLRGHFQASEVSLVTCTACLTRSPHHEHAAHAGLIRAAEAKGIPVIDKSIHRLEGLKENRIRLVFEDGSRETFEKAWVFLGWHKVNNELARQAGAATDAEGFVRTSEDCEALSPDGSPVPGLYVVGDLRSEAWKQIPTAWGGAETAVTHAYAVRL